MSRVRRLRDQPLRVIVLILVACWLCELVLVVGIFGSPNDWDAEVWFIAGLATIQLAIGVSGNAWARTKGRRDRIAA